MNSTYLRTNKRLIQDVTGRSKAGKTAYKAEQHKHTPIGTLNKHWHSGQGLKRKSKQLTTAKVTTSTRKAQYTRVPPLNDTNPKKRTYRGNKLKNTLLAMLSAVFSWRIWSAGVAPKKYLVNRGWVIDWNTSTFKAIRRIGAPLLLITAAGAILLSSIYQVHMQSSGPHAGAAHQPIQATLTGTDPHTIVNGGTGMTMPSSPKTMVAAAWASMYTPPVDTAESTVAMTAPTTADTTPTTNPPAASSPTDNGGMGGGDTGSGTPTDGDSGNGDTPTDNTPPTDDGGSTTQPDPTDGGTTINVPPVDSPIIQTAPVDVTLPVNL